MPKNPLPHDDIVREIRELAVRSDIPARPRSRTSTARKCPSRSPSRTGWSSSPWTTAAEGCPFHNHPFRLTFLSPHRSTSPFSSFAYPTGTNTSETMYSDRSSNLRSPATRSLRGYTPSHTVPNPRTRAASRRLWVAAAQS